MRVERMLHARGSNIRSVSTLIGAIIALAAIISVIASATYILRIMTISEASIGRLQAQRINELVAMYDSIVVSKDELKLCFNSILNEKLINKIIVIGKHKVNVYSGNCIPSSIIANSTELVLVSRSGALLALRSSLLKSFEGTSTLRGIITGLKPMEVQSDMSIDIAPWTIDMLANTMFLENKYTYIKLNISVLLNKEPVYDYGYRVTVLSINDTVASIYTSMLSTYYRGDEPFERSFGPLTWSVNRVNGPPYILRISSNTICVYDRLASADAGGYISGFDALICVTRGVLSGRNIVINSTLVWLDSPLGAKLVQRTVEEGFVTVWLGPSSGVVPIVTIRRIINGGDVKFLPGEVTLRSLVNAYDILAESTRPLEEGSALHFAPPVYSLVRVAPQNAYIEVEQTGRVVTSESMPYRSMFTTILAYLYKRASGELPPLYVIYAIGVDNIYLAPLYVPGFFTYVEVPPSTQCKLIRLRWKPPIPASGTAWVPGMVCIKTGDYNATLYYKLFYADLYNRVFEAKDIVQVIKEPGEIISCYYPVTLVCNGTVYIYYSFAPSILYETDIVAKLLKDLEQLAIKVSKTIAERGLTEPFDVGDQNDALEIALRYRYVYSLHPVFVLIPKLERGLSEPILYLIYDRIAALKYCGVVSITQLNTKVVASKLDCYNDFIPGVGVLLVRLDDNIYRGRGGVAKALLVYSAISNKK